MTSVIKERARKGVLGKVRTYGEITDYLDACPLSEYGDASLARMKALDTLFDNVSESFDTILVGGTNAKSSTMNFAAKLFNEEGFTIGLAYTSHFLTYNERTWIDAQQISNKQFTEIVNQVINAAEMADIQATVQEIMLMASFLHFRAEKVSVALVEVAVGGLKDAANICQAKITAVTRIAHDHMDILGDDLDVTTQEMLGVTKKDAWFISAEQSKIRLAKMKEWVEARGGKWAMPIRKLAALPYIFEQLYGRTASLAERIAQIYIEDIKGKFSPFLRGNLLATQRGQRGRPTIEAKRRAELNPIKTLKSFWSEQFSLLRGRFELLDKDKPTVLLDNAHNMDALDNVFLGIRLLHYQRPLKGFTLVMGLNSFHPAAEVMKQIRYLFKKVAGQVFFVPLPGNSNSFDPEELAALAKDLNIKAKAYSSFAQAYDAAEKTVDERQGLVAITGSASIVGEYWKHKGIKRFS